MAKEPRIVVLGAGSVGCFIGGVWRADRADVGFIGRENVCNEISKHGLRLSDLEGWNAQLPPGEVNFSTKPAALAKADIVLLCTKSSGTEAAAKQIAVHAKRKPAVISFQNGISNVDVLKKALPKLQVLRGMVPFNIAHLGQGRWHKGVAGDLVVEDSAVTRELAARFKSGPARVKPGINMERIAWGKLLINLNNAVNALSGKTLLEQLGQRDYRRVVAASMVEALEVLGAAGIEPAQLGPIPPKLLPHAIGAPDLVFKHLLLRVQKIDADARSSMHDDLVAGRATEIDHLNGEVVKLAEKIGRDAPVNRAIVDLVKQREAGVEHLWSASDLRKYVLEGHRGAAGFGY
ncbi:MAG TPA: 2-dehydropantoate 2-reductase [Allosphingosinicella sp.]|uniref:2-dehydropantoate 2-reductase n=1 Tax=Allosphingosinicella sp. TaxID=2823234 RepID=UPI002EDA55BB